ncbi:type VII secretion protein EccB [Mycobacteroides abscessus]|uniref:type VII secretion protein EccB n=1 Tax=Mycobacteroides abscessus TaxID=36809 RepID=UPI000C26BCAE|nr:type VII secretion protein EccB [Mycobacteroides abscessus]MBN7374151.1 type VII secretion protein EccB [Mycobacteroides abscessus subsp. abscessus]RIR16434.1 type VII secretion protein EccB [Mycobacteroides abscessus]
MPVNLTSKPQLTGYRFLKRRVAHAFLRRSAKMQEEWERNLKFAVIASIIIGLGGVAGCWLTGWWRPDGLVGTEKIVADSKQGTLYVNIDGRLHPVLNLVSAQLIAGQADQPAFVGAGEIAKAPRGQTVGIDGGPLATPAVLAPDVSRWAVCDTTSATLAGTPVVTAIDGQLTIGDRTRVLAPGEAALMSYGPQTYVVTDGVRMPIDLADRAVAGPLGIEVGVPVAGMSKALYNAIPAGGRLVVPSVPNAGAPAPVDVGVPVVNGAVVVTRDVATGTDLFYVIAGDGKQQISPVVAGMLRQRDTFGLAAPPRVPPDRIEKVPTRHTLDVDFYPKNPLQLVDSRDQPVTCAAWERGFDERQGRMSLISSRGLPVTAEQARAAIPLVGGGNGGVQADQAVFSQGAATFLTTTGSALDSPARQTLWLLDSTGIRYGVPFDDRAQGALKALGLNQSQARMAPWSMLEVWPAGPELSIDAARVIHGAVPGAAVPIPAGVGEGR